MLLWFEAMMIAISLEILIFIVLFVLGHIFWVYPDFIHGYQLEFPLGVQDHCHFISRAQVPLLDISFVFNLGVESRILILFRMGVMY